MDESKEDRRARGRAKSVKLINTLMRRLATERKRRKPDRRRNLPYRWNRGQEIVLTPALATRLKAVVRKLIKTGELEKHPYDVVEDRVLTEILHLQPGGKKAPALAVVQALKKLVRTWRVIIPLSGLTLDDDVTIDFGQTIQLVRLNEASFEREVMSADAHVLEGKPGAESILSAHQRLLGWMRNSPCVVFYFNGVHESIRSQILETRVQPIVDFIQYCVTIRSLQGQNPVIDATGRFSHQPSKYYPLIAVDAFFMHNLTGGRTAELTRKDIRVLKKQGVIQLAPIFATELTDDDESYDALLRRAIENFSDGERSLSPRQRVMSYITCLEVFFNSPELTEHAVCCGVAYAFSDDPLTMKQYYLAVKSMYGDRSLVAHRGRMPKQLAECRRIAMHTILRMISRRGEFTNKVALDDWRASGATIMETVVTRPKRDA
jgi:hypothetical protein